MMDFKIKHKEADEWGKVLKTLNPNLKIFSFQNLATKVITHFQPDVLRILVYLEIYDSGKVSLEHLLLSRHPSQNIR